ncbi:carcinoembryonic antigen-related cell adhesion molecule 7-like [Dendropsophus ebraccatus]|uniref:carcinoembryonic antigen-related cell adhesion molecule 7-like n=1 Tax=Dendropsophus ebraccatus TaxID=150705 RepID=UPI00383158D7
MHDVPEIYGFTCGRRTPARTTDMRGFTLAGVFCLWIDLTIGILIELIPSLPLVNHSVLLRVSQINGTVWSFSWFKGELARSQNQILAYSKRNGPPESPGPLYSPRFGSYSNASLEIVNLYFEDQGTYTVQVTTDRQVRNATQLHVYALVTKPIIRSSALYAVGNQTVTLTCDTKNFEKIHWGRIGKTLPTAVIWSYNYSAMTFPNIKSLDAGQYWCEAVNAVSKMTSDIYTFNVYCVCGSESGLSAGEIAGIIVGIILGLVLLVGGAFLYLFLKRRRPPVIEEPREETRKSHGPPIDYYNVQAMAEPNPANREPAYMDLQYSSRDIYSNLQN